MSVGFRSLPDDLVVAKIFSKLENEHFSSVPVVCHKWNALSNKTETLMSRYRDKNLSQAERDKLYKLIFAKLKAPNSKDLMVFARAFHFIQQAFNAMGQLIRMTPTSNAHVLQQLFEFMANSGASPKSSLDRLSLELIKSEIDKLRPIMESSPACISLFEIAMSEAKELETHYPFLYEWLTHKFTTQIVSLNSMKRTMDMLMDPVCRFIESAEPEENLYECMFGSGVLGYVNRLRFQQAMEMGHGNELFTKHFMIVAKVFEKMENVEIISDDLAINLELLKCLGYTDQLHNECVANGKRNMETCSNMDLSKIGDVDEIEQLNVMHAVSTQGKRFKWAKGFKLQELSPEIVLIMGTLKSKGIGDNADETCAILMKERVNPDLVESDMPFIDERVNAIVASFTGVKPQLQTDNKHESEHEHESESDLEDSIAPSEPNTKKRKKM